MYSERHRPDLQTIWSVARLGWRNCSHQKFTGLYLFATIWMANRVASSGVVKTDAVPSL